MSDRPTIRVTRGDIDIAAWRARNPELDIVDARPHKSWWWDVLLGWVWVFGVWPLSHPEHDFTTVMGSVDLTLHFGAFIALSARWKLERR